MNMSLKSFSSKSLSDAVGHTWDLGFDLVKPLRLQIRRSASLSNGEGLINATVSLRSASFTSESKSESLARAGHAFTSTNHGLAHSSRIISTP